MANTSRNQNTSSKPVVIALHGSASTGAQWDKLTDRLAVDFDVIAPDLPGYGKLRGLRTFGRPTLYGDAFQIACHAHQAAAPVHLVADGYGAAVALKYALENPAEVASLTLIEPVLFHLLRYGGHEDMHDYNEITAMADTMRAACLNGAPKHGMACLVDYWNGAGTWDAMSPMDQAKMAAHAPKVAGNFTAALAESWDASLCRRIHCPVTIITREQCRSPVERVARILACALPNARHETIAGAGRKSLVTQHDAVAPIIAQTLTAATPVTEADSPAAPVLAAA